MTNEHHYAVVVGINRYPGIRDLNAARRDAADFANWLRDPSGGDLPDDDEHIIEVAASADDEVLDSPSRAVPNQSEIDEKLYRVNLRVQALWQQPEQWQRSRLYLFLAGHGGAPEGGKAALLTADANPGLLGRHIEVMTYAAYYQRCAYFREVIILADCCRNRFANVTAHPPGLTGCPTTRGQVGLLLGYATAFNDPAYEQTEAEAGDDGRRGYFSKALLHALNGAAADPATGEITSRTLEVPVQQAVRALSAGRPEPQDAMIVVESPWPIVFRPAGTPPGRPRHWVTLRFRAGQDTPVRLQNGFGRPLGEWDPAQGPWTIQLEEGLYEVVPAQGPTEPNPFAEGGRFKVFGRDSDVEL
jgi:uncharacterized caspase-like protein